MSGAVYDARSSRSFIYGKHTDVLTGLALRVITHQQWLFFEQVEEHNKVRIACERGFWVWHW